MALTALAYCATIMSLCLSANLVTAARYEVKGSLVIPDKLSDDSILQFLQTTKVILNGGEFVSYLTDDGSFVFTNLPGQAYTLEVASPLYRFDTIRLDVSKRFENNVRASKADFLGGSTPTRVMYHPNTGLRIFSRGKAQYFEAPKAWNIKEMIMSPMILVTVVPLVLMLFTMKMMNNMSPEQIKEMQENPLFGSQQGAPQIDVAASLAKFTASANAAPQATKKKEKAIKR